MNFISERLTHVKMPLTIPTERTVGIEHNNEIFLNCGEPDFDTPQNIKKAGRHAINKGKTKYTPIEGVIELKKAVCNKLKIENNLSYDTSQVIISNGSKHVIYNAMMATLNLGDEVIIPSPFWVSYPEIVLLAGGIPKIVPCKESNNFKVSPKDLESSINARTKWVILNSPNNPTGTVYSFSELKEISSILLQHKNIHILCDDIYEHITFSPVPFVTLANVEPLLYDRILLVNAVSKAYAMTGWRIGYGASKEALINAMITIQSHSTSNPCSISQEAAIEALNGDQSFLKKIVNSYERRRDFLVKKIRAIPGISCVLPEGGIYVYANCSEFIGKRDKQGNTINTDVEFVKYITDSFNVRLVAGQDFGMSPYFRISFAASQADLKEACYRIGLACQMLTN